MKKILTFIISMFIITACQQDEEESINRSNESTTTLSISKELRILRIPFCNSNLKLKDSEVPFLLQ